MSSRSHNINGVNWASIKKFAKFTFGEANAQLFKVDKDKRHFFVYLNKRVYNENRDLVEDFENKFYVIIKPID